MALRPACARVLGAVVVLAGCGTQPLLDGGSDAARDGDSTVIRPDVNVDATDASFDVVMPPFWPCPTGWVASARGGCGPAVFLCAPDGGAASGACSAVNITVPVSAPEPDGGAGATFYALPDGGIGGGWSGATFAADGGALQCPPGWISEPGGTCDSALRTDCPTGTAALPGGVCTPTGVADCPTLSYPDLGPETLGMTVVYVAHTADAGTGDGTPTMPFGTIAAGIAAAGNGGWVFVGAGTYGESLDVTASVHIVGVCAARVTIAATTTSPTITVAGASAIADVRRVQLGGSAQAIVVNGGGELSTSAVLVDGATGTAIDVSGTGTQVSLTDTFVTGTLPTLTAAPGIGLRVTAGATLHALRLVHAANHDGVIASGAGTTVVLDTVILRDAQARYDALTQAGLDVLAGASVQVTRATIASNLGFGVLVEGTGSSLALADSVVSDTLPLDAMAPGNGLRVDTGATATVSRTQITGNRGRGIDVEGAGTRVSIADVAVDGTLPRVDGTEGFGILSGTGGTFAATRAVLAQNTEGGLLAVDGNVTGTDVIVVDVAPSVRGLGFGAFASGASVFDGVRLTVRNVNGFALGTMYSGTPPTGAGSTVNVQDLFVDGVTPSTIGVNRSMPTIATGSPAAYGIVASDDCMTMLTNTFIGDGDVGIFATGGALTMMSGVVTGENAPFVQSNAGDGMLTALSNVVFYQDSTSTGVTDSMRPQIVFSSP